MTVHILTKGYDYEGQDIVGVFEDFKQAQKIMYEMCGLNTDVGLSISNPDEDRLKFNGANYYIEEWEVK